MPFHPTYIAQLQAELRTAMVRTQTRGKPWKSRAFRYSLEDNSHIDTPERSMAHLIPTSKAARILIREAFGGGKGNSHRAYRKLGLRYEHAVPLSVLWGELLKVHLSAREIEETILGLYQCVWVTFDEDSRLNQLGFRSKMPEGWVQKDGWGARYVKAKIPIVFD